MTEAGHVAQIVRVTEEYRFELDQQELARVLLSEETRELPVVVVSVAGAYRGGKSFLLNFFLRYLTSPQSAREDGSWLGGNGEPLDGFSSKSGSTRHTTGILIWSKPVVCLLPSGTKVAVILMDTQGTFDSSSTVNDCSTIFALSTLLSSVQIYNLSMNIQEDHLQHLHLFTEYGRLIRVQGSNEKAFQILTVLVRDWQWPWEHSYGTAGGEGLLQTRLQINGKMKKELQEVREHIHSCFDKVTCFLMPRPGDNVLRPDFNGDINAISEDFRVYVSELVSSIFRPENLQPKVINGKMVKAKELFNYFESYIKVFGSGKLPPTTSIMKATTEVGLKTAVDEGLAVYDENMERECGKNAKCVPALDIKVLHDRYKELALKSFSEKKKMGTKDITKSYYDKLSTDIEKRVEKYTAVNAVKQNDLIKAANEAYKVKKNEFIKNDRFCVHPYDVEAIHRDAYNIAIAIFDSGRKCITNQKDQDRDDFIKSFVGKYEVLKRNNESSNEQIIGDLRFEYYQLMENARSAEPPLLPAQVDREHESALANILTRFGELRSLPNSYPEDVYKLQLIQTAMARFEEIKTVNRSARRREMNRAISLYDAHIALAWDPRTKNLHPKHLEDAHDTAKRLALKSFSPSNQNSDRNAPNDDENVLLTILSSRYNELQATNEIMNNEAIESAYDVFITTLDEKRRPTLWWIAVVPAVYDMVVDISGANFNESKEDAEKEFYSKRKNNGPAHSDIYLSKLHKLIDKHDRLKMFENAVNDMVEKGKEVVENVTEQVLDSVKEYLNLGNIQPSAK